MTFDPRTLTAETAATLSGRELEIAIDDLVRRVDRTPDNPLVAELEWCIRDFSGEDGLPSRDEFIAAYRADPTPLDNDRAVELHKRYHLVVQNCEHVVSFHDEWLAGTADGQWIADGPEYRIAVGRAAVVKAIRA